MPALCVGHWGALYPRAGFVIHVSDAVASALTAYRAVDIASFGFLTAHRVIAPLLFRPGMFTDRMQMVVPVAGQCRAIGDDPALWDHDDRSEQGRYVWIYWRQKECCLF